PLTCDVYTPSLHDALPIWEGEGGIFDGGIDQRRGFGADVSGSGGGGGAGGDDGEEFCEDAARGGVRGADLRVCGARGARERIAKDRKSTRMNSSHRKNSDA